jgi:hypothetical protein
MKSFRIYSINDQYDLCVVTGYTPDYNVFIRDKQNNNYEIGNHYYKASEVNQILDTKPVGDVLEHYRELAAKIISERK